MARKSKYSRYHAFSFCFALSLGRATELALVKVKECIFLSKESQTSVSKPIRRDSYNPILRESIPQILAGPNAGIFVIDTVISVNNRIKVINLQTISLKHFHGLVNLKGVKDYGSGSGQSHNNFSQSLEMGWGPSCRFQQRTCV